MIGAAGNAPFVGRDSPTQEIGAACHWTPSIGSYALRLLEANDASGNAAWIGAFRSRRRKPGTKPWRWAMNRITKTVALANCHTHGADPPAKVPQTKLHNNTFNFHKQLKKHSRGCSPQLFRLVFPLSSFLLAI